ncbi:MULTISPECIES: type VI secretion system protein [unclassified Francisella]|uniref:type VI secretion system protein n=1 Tax=unclassified Francisella TaxID=2610885 RepID=UPI002E3586D5|nr:MULTISPECIES: type VI secretion system protein [unclassified Francisella]MED7818344.1 type VI secretion system protein [Francisella sp. 19S2-4]MED7829180.1 type VI secretion system protein [Francisella sp. 19S2-10]
MFEKSKKYIFIVGLVILFLLSFYLCLVFDISFWFGFIIFVAVLASVFIIEWLVKFAIAKYKIYKKNADDIRKFSKQSLLDSFNSAIDYSKKYYATHKKRQSWFVVFGGAKSGKSSLFNTGDKSKNAYGYCWSKENLTAAEINGDIFLDKPSRASIISCEVLLNNIRRAIKLNRINFKGFVITVSIEDLQKENESLSTYAAKIRSRIDNSFYKLGLRYPIYILITKADKLQGFESFSLGLPDKLTNNAFGELFKEIDQVNKSGNSIVQSWVEKLIKRIKVFNTVSLQTNGSLLPRALLFEKSIKKIESKLQTFVNELVKEKQDQPSKDKPLLRGMFLTSSNSLDISRNIDNGSLLESVGLNIYTRSNNKKLYVRNLINDVLAFDNDLYKPLHKKLKRVESYKKLSFFSWWSLFVAITIYLAFAYTHTLRVFNQIEVSNALESKSFTGNLTNNFEVISSIDKNINKVKKIKQNWFFSIWPYALPFDYIIDKFENKYVYDFNKHIRGQLSQTTAESVNLALQEKYKNKYGNVVRRLLESKILIQEKLQGNASNFESLRMPSVLMGKTFDNNKYGSLYKKYIKWNDDKKQLLEIKNQDEEFLNGMDIPNHSYDWLILWASQSTRIAPIQLSDFWSEYNGENVPEIQSAFNIAMLPHINKFVANIDRYTIPSKSGTYSQKFFASYSLAAYKAWINFTREFTANDNTVPTEGAWYTILEQNSFDSFYINYANKFTTNFDSDLFINKPEWLKLFVRLNKYFSLSKIVVEKQAQLNKDSWFSKVINELNTSPEEIDKQKHIPGFSQKVLSAVNQYLLSVYSLQSQAITLGDQPAYQAMLSLANDKKDSAIPAVKDTHVAYTNFQKLKTVVNADMPSLSINSNHVTWDFYKNNLDLLLYGVSKKASCHIQFKWNEDILKKDKISGSDTISQLYSRKSDIFKFMQKYVYPFVQYNVATKSFAPKEIYGQKIEFSKEAYKYLNNEVYYRNMVDVARNLESSLENQGNKTMIHTDPVSVNKGAKVLPYSTVYSFVCNGKKETFTNYNTSFDFAIPSKVLSCKYISIQVNFKGINSFSATKTFTGKYPILELLADLNKNGNLVVNSDLFADPANELEAYGITHVTIPIALKDMKLPSMIENYKKNKNLLMKNNLQGQNFDISPCWK